MRCLSFIVLVLLGCDGADGGMGTLRVAWRIQGAMNCAAASADGVQITAVDSHATAHTGTYPCANGAAVMTGLPADAYDVRLTLLDKSGAQVLGAIDMGGVAVSPGATTDLGQLMFAPTDTTVVPAGVIELDAGLPDAMMPMPPMPKPDASDHGHGPDH